VTAALLGCLAAGPVSAQTEKIPPFDAATIRGITPNIVSSSGTSTSWSFSLGSTASSSFSYNVVSPTTPAGTFNIDQIIGVYIVSNPEISPDLAIGTTAAGWTMHAGGTKDGFKATGFQTKSISDTPRIENGETVGNFTWRNAPSTYRWNENLWWGFHLRWFVNGTSGATQTGYVYGRFGDGGGGSPPVVPESSSMALMLGGAIPLLGFARSRAKMRSRRPQALP
jgi:hypothetical protein